MTWASITTEEHTEQTAWAERPDAQLADLLETVWACERAAHDEDRIDAVIRYGARQR